MNQRKQRKLGDRIISVCIIFSKINLVTLWTVMPAGNTNIGKKEKKKRKAKYLKS